MNKSRFSKSIFIVILITLLITSCTRKSTAVPQPHSIDYSKTPPADLTEAFEAAVEAREDALLSFVVYDVQIDQVTYSIDNQLALLWLRLVDPNTGETIESEPGLAVARRDQSKNKLKWVISMQVDEDWEAILAGVPDYMLSTEMRSVFTPHVPGQGTLSFSGYKLPWASGQAKRLTQSIGHKYVYGNCPTCLYAFDFADSTQFPLLASKGGTVKFYNWNCPNNDHSCNNYVVLEDLSTNPVTYQLYLHMAYNTMPTNLRSAGAVVQQGQYIGNVDNTGASTGSHLHFHVHTNPNSYWGTAQDIQFSDVDINGGRPRMCSETNLSSTLEGWYPNCHSGGDWFVSGNIGANPPSAALSSPANGAAVTTSTLTVGGNASDNIGITRVEVLANWQGSWQTIGSPILYNPARTSTSFSTSLDLCAANIPNGPIDLAVRAYDYEGNATSGLTGLRTVVKNYACPANQTTTCEPGPNEVTLFTDPGYYGACEVFDITTNNGSGPGWYTSAYLGLVGNNNAASVKVGSNVRAILYDNGNFTGRPNALEIFDANLDDNRLGGVDRLSSLIVESRSEAPSAPVIDTPKNGANLNPTSADSLVIAWWRGSATSYYATLSGPVNKSTGFWIPANTWSVGSLPAGTYTVTVQARNAGGTSQASKTFTIAAGSLPASAPRTAPISDIFDNGALGWTGTGLWHLGGGSAQGSAGPLVLTYEPKFIEQPQAKTVNSYWSVNNGVDYVNTDLWGHDLTSGPIVIPATGNWWLDFDNYTSTESAYTFWDKRLVQVAVEGGSFQDVYAMSQDPQQYWLAGPVISLNSYRGKTIRVRFHFDTIDTYYNNTSGWWIDNIRIFQDNTIPGSCVDNPVDNSLTQARLLAANSTLNGYICGAGDVDYFRFEGQAGQHVSFDVDAQSIGSSLDPVLYLMDSIGGLITVHDDEVPAQLIDPLLGYDLPRTGTYFLKLQAWDHPGAGGTAFNYRIRAITDNNPPSIIISTPVNSLIPSGAFTITAAASDSGTGVNRVEFYYHTPNWQTGTWQYLGVDFDSSNGYTQQVDPAVIGSLVGGAIYARAVDGAGNTWGDLRVNLQTGTDSTAPVVSLSAIPTPVTSTYFTLTWSGYDSGSGLDHYELAYRIGTGDWIGWGGSMPASQTSIWFLADFYQTYSFRLRAVDKAGNVSTYSEKSVSIGSCTGDWLEDGDDVATGASPLAINTNQEHNFCTNNDSDWLRPNPVGGPVTLYFQPLNGGAAAVLELYDPTGNTLLATSSSNWYNQGTSLSWYSRPGINYRVRVRPLHPRLGGTTCRYRVVLNSAHALFLPAIIYR